MKATTDEHYDEDTGMGCPEITTLAAFVDGRLAGRERRRFMEHLDSCPTCFEVYVETARFQQDRPPAEDSAFEDSAARARPPRSVVDRLIGAIRALGRRPVWGLAVPALAAAAVLVVSLRPPSLDGLLDKRGLRTLPGWVAAYGEVDAARLPSASRVDAVFGRVFAVADKARDSTTPRLAVVAEESFPVGIALEDGNIVLSAAVLKLCYEGATPEEGDARLAFVLGHELAHLAHDDPWHAHAFASLEGASGPAEAARGLVELLGRDPAAGELRADRYALFYLFLAGYDPAAVVGEESSFLDAWAEQVTTLTAFPEGRHPSSGERTGALRAVLERVRDDLALFDFGVWAYQAGRYADAAIFFERFAAAFPSREVYNNLGLSHYQLAFRSLVAADVTAALRFRLPAILDTRTLARPLGYRRGPEPAGCRADRGCEEHVALAIAALEKAAELDRGYLPAALNLTSAQVLAGQSLEAFAAARRALTIAPRDLRVRIAHQVASFLLAREERAEVDLVPLRELRVEHPRSAAIAYNLASILTELGMPSEEAWEGFLQLEPAGVFAERARGVLRRPPGEADAVPAASDLPAPPLPLGEISAATAERLRGMQQTTQLVLAGLDATIYESADLRVLQVGEFVEMVEERLVGSLPGDAWVRESGRVAFLVHPEAGVAFRREEELLTARLFFRSR